MKKILFFMVITVCFMSLMRAQVVFRSINYDSVIFYTDTQISDFDGDGDLDAVLISGDSLKFFENDGDGVFSKPQIVATANFDGVFYMKKYDLDADGDDDIVSVSRDNDNVFYFLNNGDGTFTSQQIITDTIDGAIGFAVGDLNNDMLPDIVVGGMYCNKTYVLKNNGNFNFSVEKIFYDVHSYDYLIEDLDGDGYNDIVFSSPLKWTKNNGNFNFSELTAIDINNSGAKKILAYDLDGDGIKDLIAQFSFDNILAWYHSNGNGSFGDKNILKNNFDVSTIAVADLDADGDNDVLGWEYLMPAELYWFENKGDNNFTEHLFSHLPFAYSVNTADFDGDGDMDILAVGADLIIFNNVNRQINNNVCEGNNAFFHYDDEFMAYQWQKKENDVFVNITDDDIFSGTTTNELTINNNTNLDGTVYRCQLIYYLGNRFRRYDTVYSPEISVSVLPLPETGDIVGNPHPEAYSSEVYAITGEENSVFSWEVQGGAITENNNTSITVLWGDAGSGSISAVETNQNGCSGDTVVLNVTITAPAGVGENTDFCEIYPNPAKDIVMIKTNSKIKKAEITDLCGKKVIVSQEKTINLSGLMPGIYTIKVYSDNKVFERKLIKE